MSDEKKAANAGVAEQNEEKFLHPILRSVQLVREDLEERDVEKRTAGDALKTENKLEPIFSQIWRLSRS